jgi:integrase
MTKTTLAINFEQGKKIAYKKIAEKEDIGIFILLILETGLRIGDALALTKINFHGTDGDYFLKFTAQKTRKSAKRPISKILYESITKRKNEKIFHSPKTGIVYSKMWVGRNIKSCFLKEFKLAKQEDRTISAHSLRKSAGQRVYEINGIEAARDFLQHQTYQTTKDYLSIGERKLNILLRETLID